MTVETLRAPTSPESWRIRLRGSLSIPTLVVVGLDLPKKDGREVLEELEADPDPRRIPVVVLTTSHSEEDVLASYNLHTNCYVTKPVDLDPFFAVIRAVDELWLAVVRLPPESSS
jgi:DNA-binding response OmpR family regulator